MNAHLSESELFAGLVGVEASPKDAGALEMIVIRPGDKLRTVVQECWLSRAGGAEGDAWARGCWKTLPDGSPHPDVQLTLMNSRCVALLAREKSRWPLAGDQLYVDLDLSRDNLPVGQQLAIGDAVVEITEIAHTGCADFAARYGAAALKFVNSSVGKQLRLRGVYARVLRDGFVRVGDGVNKLPPRSRDSV